MGGHHIFVPEQRGTRHSSTELQRRARGTGLSQLSVAWTKRLAATVEQGRDCFAVSRRRTPAGRNGSGPDAGHTREFKETGAGRTRILHPCRHVAPSCKFAAAAAAAAARALASAPPPPLTRGGACGAAGARELSAHRWWCGPRQMCERSRVRFPAEHISQPSVTGRPSA
eukprot:gene201-biopygen12075